MKHRSPLVTLFWNLSVPVVSCAVIAATLWQSPGVILISLVAVTLVVAVIAAVHHAEVIARRVGEPFGTLILALAVTVIEVALIVSIMLTAGASASAVARDTVFATVMIVCNGVVGLCLLLGALRHHELEYRVEGTSSALSVLMALTTLTLILPTLTTSTPGPTFSPAQLIFAGVMSLVLYGVFVFVQTVRHREDFVPLTFEHAERVEDDPAHAPMPSATATLTSLILLCILLLVVVGLAKSLAPSIQSGVKAASAPPAVVGVIIALLVLLPETLAAVRAALRNRMQTSLNLALGSALATIGLTIPSVACVSLLLDLPLALGLPPKETAMLVLTFLVSTATLAGGRATVLQGAVHLVLFATFLFLAVVP